MTSMSCVTCSGADTLAATEQSSCGKTTVVLEESEDPPYELNVTGVPYDTIAFKTDRFPPADKRFQQP